MSEVIRRCARDPVAVREGDGAPTTLEGYAAVFDQVADIGGMFRERIAPGAFADAIGRDDVRALWNHDPNYVLGRTVAQTLRLEEDARGLRYVVTPPATQWARDLLVSVARGDVTQSSFGFEVTGQQWARGDGTMLPLRTITKVRLHDVSPVTYPAYDETSVTAREAQDAAAVPHPQPGALLDDAEARLRLIRLLEGD